MNIIVVGGGAAGLMAAIHAARTGAKVTVLEKENRPGVKLLKTGNGRCNFTNTGNPEGCYRGQDLSFVQSVLERFSSSESIRFFEEIGVFSYHGLGDSWIYPHSEQAASLLNALLKECERLRVRIKTQETVTAVRRQSSGFTVETLTWSYRADRVIVTVGSPASLPKERESEYTNLFHDQLKSRPYQPALTYLRIEEKQMGKWAGVRARGRVRLLQGDQVIREEVGQIQFTAKGISGIAVFNLSYEAGQLLHTGKNPVIELDLASEFEEEDLRERLHRIRMQERGVPEEQLLQGLIPDKLIPFLIRKRSGDQDLAYALKHFRLKVKGTGDLDTCQAAAGGISLEEVNWQTMEVKRISDLYFAGEVLDVVGNCGGWNLQFAWASGAIAGTAAGKTLANIQ